MPDKKVIFISCGIFQEELRYLIREKGLDWDVVYLEAALHVDFDLLKERLVEALELHAKDGVELKVVYGLCHPDIMDILERYGARRLGAGNCIEAMVGPGEVERLNREGTAFFLSVGWVNNWEKMFKLGAERFGFDFKNMFGAYKRIIVFDTGVIPLDGEKIRAFSEFTRLPVETVRISLDRLENLVEGI